MNVMEPLADMATGMAAARAGEPDTGLDGSGHTTKRLCLNCRTTLVGAYCHGCGQKGHVHRTLSAFAHDLLHGVLHLEGKTWRTLPMLVWRPGDLTRRYIEGERARFVSPLALFLFSVFLMFAVLSAAGGPVPGDTARQVQTGMSDSVRESEASLFRLEQRRAAMAGTDAPTGSLDAELQAARSELAVLKEIQREGLLTGITHRIVDDLPPGFWKKAVAKFNADPALTTYKLQANAYKFSWLLIPIFVPLVWLLFLWRPKHWRLYDHVVFTTYSLSFQSLSLVLFVLLARSGFPFGWLLTAASIAIWLHIYRQFRGAYGLGRLSSLWRMMALSTLAGVAMGLFLLTLIAIGAAG